jgi:calcineurin-like phosphoesterase family protein
MLNKPYKFRREDFDQILFTSDQHYNHDPKWDKPLWSLRGFKNVDEHDEWLRSEYSKVSDLSIIFSLGDPALNSTPEKLFGLLNQTSAHIYHIWGNHFSCDYAIYRSAMNLYLTEEKSYYDEVVLDVTAPLAYEIYPFTVTRYFYDNVATSFHVKYPDKKLINGYPGLVGEPPALTFLGSEANIQIDKRLIHLSHMAPLIWERGAVALFGHSHGDLEGAQPSDKSRGKMFDCGIENSKNYNGSAFFTFEDVVRIMDSKPNISLDHADR